MRLTRANFHFDKSELSKIAPRFSMILNSMKGLFTVDFYWHGYHVLKGISEVYEFLKKIFGAL